MRLTGDSAKTAKAAQNAEALTTRVGNALASEMAQTNFPRFLGLDWVKMHVIDEFGSLGYGEKEHVRAHWLVACHPQFPVKKLHRKNVKDHVVELYAATTDKIRRLLADEVGQSRSIHLNTDLWVDKFSNLKYMGECRRGRRTVS